MVKGISIKYTGRGRPKTFMLNRMLYGNANKDDDGKRRNKDLIFFGNIENSIEVRPLTTCNKN